MSARCYPHTAHRPRSTRLRRLAPLEYSSPSALAVDVHVLLGVGVMLGVHVVLGVGVMLGVHVVLGVGVILGV